MGHVSWNHWQKADSITITIRTYNLAILANGRHIESRLFDCTYRCLWWLNVRGNLLAWRHWNSTVTRALACRTTNMTHRIVWCIMRRHLWRHNDRWCSIFTVFAQRARIAGFQCDRTCTWPWWMARTNQSEANKDKRKSIKRSRLFVIRVRTFRVFRSAININLPWLLNCGGVGGLVVGGGPTWMLIAAGPEMRCFCLAWMPWPMSSNME